MILYVTDALMEDIKAHALTAYPEECCGVLIGDLPEDFGQSSAELRVTETRRLENAWENLNRTNKYAVAPEAIAAVEKEFAGKPRGILGFYHSHPDVPAWPSPYDLQRAWPSYAYLIAAVAGGKVTQRRVWLLSYDTRSFEEHKLKVVQDACMTKIVDKR